MPPKQAAAAATAWTPRAGELTWTRIDKSTTRALGMIIRLPAQLPEAAAPQPSVYCELDGPDRYSVACLTRHGDQDSHVYVPRYYMNPFNLAAAENLKCMRTRPKDVRDLTPWDRDKRHSIKVVQRWEQTKDAAELKPVHNFVNCPECCDEASDAFWAAVRLERGDAHLARKDSLTRRRQQVQKEVEERARVLRDRELKAASRRPRSSPAAADDPSASTSGGEDEEEASSVSTTTSAEEEEPSSSSYDEESEQEEVAEAAPGSGRKRTRRGAARRKYFLDSPSSSSGGTEAEEAA